MVGTYYEVHKSRSLSKWHDQGFWDLARYFLSYMWKKIFAHMPYTVDAHIVLWIWTNSAIIQKYVLNNTMAMAVVYQYKSSKNVTFS